MPFPCSSSSFIILDFPFSVGWGCSLFGGGCDEVERARRWKISRVKCLYRMDLFVGRWSTEKTCLKRRLGGIWGECEGRDEWEGYPERWSVLVRLVDSARLTMKNALYGSLGPCSSVTADCARGLVSPTCQVVSMARNET